MTDFLTGFFSGVDSLETVSLSHQMDKNEKNQVMQMRIDEDAVDADHKK